MLMDLQTVGFVRPQGASRVTGQERNLVQGERLYMTDTAATFRHLHAPGEMLLLPNAGDAGSARLLRSLGARAVATSSAGMAWAHGYADGALPREDLLWAVERIVRAVDVPVSVDIDHAAARDRAALDDLVACFADLGVSGVNLEDAGGPPGPHCARIERVKAQAARCGVDLFVNARTDLFLHRLGPAERRVAEAVARGEAYRQAGADGFFVPGLAEADAIEAISRAVALPLNVFVWPGLPEAGRLKALGVRRLSAGAAFAKGMMTRLRALAAGFLVDGQADVFGPGGMQYHEIDALMRAAPEDADGL